MKKTLLAVFVLGCGLTIGCDTKPQPVRISTFQPLSELGVDPQDQAEGQAALAAETARVTYLHRLKLLADHYDRVGNHDKLEWTQSELRNVQEAQWFRWTGIPTVSEPPTTAAIGADERGLVEALAEARNSYVRGLRDLHAYYEPKQPFKAQVIRRVQQRLDVVRVYGYAFEAEIPGAELKPTRPVAEAEKLFDEAMELYRSGKAIPLMPAYHKERQALMKFQDVIKKYPDSTRIAMAAFYIAEIYKEFFNENLRAVRWYERAWQWDPNIPLPARFQAAVVYDARLGDRERAIDLYRQVLIYEQSHTANVNHAQDRLSALQPRQDRTEDRPLPGPSAPSGQTPLPPPGQTPLPAPGPAPAPAR